MKISIIHTALFRIFVPIPYGALIYLLLLMINNNLLIIDESFLSIELFFCIGLTYITFESNRLSLLTIFGSNNLSIPQILVQVLVNLAITLLLIYLSLMLYFIYFLGFSSLDGFATEVQSFFIFFGISSLLYNMLSISYSLLTRRNEQLFIDEETLREQVQFELDNYQAEVNPELLFESLEVAITLIHEDIDKAEEYIDHLALVYRYMLSHKNDEFISIEKEINATRNLVYLQNAKNGGLIKIFLQSFDTQVTVIPGSVPTLVEEIIKSNIISESKPLEINLSLEDNYLTISHKLNKRLIRNESEANAFSRLQTAYSFYTDQPLVKVQAYGEAFYKLPILNLNPTAA